MLTEHSYELEYRDDLQMMTTNVYYGAPGGLKYVSGTYHRSATAARLTTAASTPAPTPH